jgi:hypothetical protein
VSICGFDLPPYYPSKLRPGARQTTAHPATHPNPLDSGRKNSSHASDLMRSRCAFVRTDRQRILYDNREAAMTRGFGKKPENQRAQGELLG